MNDMNLTELKKNADGSYEFRLLMPAVKEIKIETLTINLIDIVFAFVTNDSGIMSEHPEAKITFSDAADGNSKISRDISAGQTLSFRNWNLKLLYAFSGEMSNLSVQTAVHFRLSRNIE